MPLRLYSRHQADIADAALKAEGQETNAPILTETQQVVSFLIAHTPVGPAIDDAIHAVESAAEKGVDKAQAVVDKVLPVAVQVFADHGIDAAEKDVRDILHEATPTKFNVSELSGAANIASELLHVAKLI